MSTKAYEYKIITGHTAEVERTVQDYSSQGWKLHGSPVFMGVGGLSGHGYISFFIKVTME